jgi:hypothetical protein
MLRLSEFIGAAKKGITMSTCQSCGGIIGRDCFNPEECAWITQQQANQCEAAQYNAEEAQHSLQQLKAEIATLVDKLEAISAEYLYHHNYVIINKLRQLSAV